MVLVILACAPPEMAGSLDLRQDPLLSEVPASSTVLAGGDLAALWASPAVAWMEQDGWIRRDRIPFDPMDFRETRLGCGDGGCVLVSQGRVRRAERLSPWALQENLAIESLGERIRLVPPHGKPMEMEVTADLTRAGDLEAGRGFDPSSLGAEVPSGDAWILIRDPVRMRQQAVARVLAEGTADAEFTAAFLDQVPESALAAVESFAWSLDSQSEILTGRLVAVDADAASRFETLLRLQLDAARWTPRLAVLATNAEIRRQDKVLELEVRP